MMRGNPWAPPASGGAHQSYHRTALLCGPMPRRASRRASGPRARAATGFFLVGVTYIHHTHTRPLAVW